MRPRTDSNDYEINMSDCRPGELILPWPTRSPQEVFLILGKIRPEWSNQAFHVEETNKIWLKLWSLTEERVEYWKGLEVKFDGGLQHGRLGWRQEYTPRNEYELPPITFTPVCYAWQVINPDYAHSYPVKEQSAIYERY